MLVWHPLRPTVELGITGLAWPGGRLLVHAAPDLPDCTPMRSSWGRKGTWCISSRARPGAPEQGGFLILAGLPRIVLAFAIAGELDGHEGLHPVLEGYELGERMLDVLKTARAIKAGVRWQEGLA